MKWREVKTIRKIVKATADGSDIITIREAAKILGVQTQAVTHLLDKGHLPWIKAPSGDELPKGAQVQRYTLRSAVEERKKRLAASRLDTTNEDQADEEDKPKPPNSANSDVVFNRSRVDCANALVGARA